MEEESPETLINFVKTVTSSVHSVLRSPASSKTITKEQNYTRRRRFKKKSEVTENSLRKKSQYLAQQYSIQQMYTTSMLNAAPVCFGDKQCALLGIKPKLETNNTRVVEEDIQSCDQFLNEYIPSLGSPRENKPQSYDIYPSIDLLRYQQPDCMFDFGQTSDWEYINSLDDFYPDEMTQSQPCLTFDTTETGTISTPEEPGMTFPEWECRNESFSPILEDDSFDADAFDDFFATLEKNSCSSDSSIDSSSYSADSEPSPEMTSSSDESYTFDVSGGDLHLISQDMPQPNFRNACPLEIPEIQNVTSSVLPSFSSAFL